MIKGLQPYGSKLTGSLCSCNCDLQLSCVIPFGTGVISQEEFELDDVWEVFKERRNVLSLTIRNQLIPSDYFLHLTFNFTMPPLIYIHSGSKPYCQPCIVLNQAI